MMRKPILFNLYIDHLKKNGADDNQIIFVNLEALENVELLSYKALKEY